MPCTLRLGLCRPSCESGGIDFSSSATKATNRRTFKAAEDEAKFWLDPVTLAANYGFHGRDLNEVDNW